MATSPIITITRVAFIMSLQSAPQQSPLDLANAANSRWFVLYLVFLGLAAIGTVFFTFKLFRSGTGVQDAIRHDAEARVEGAKEQAKADIEKSRSDARVEITRVEKQSKLDIAQVEADSKERVLTLQRELADATRETKAAQTRLEQEQQKTALAQEAAAEAQHRVNEAIVGRILARNVSPRLPEILKSLPPARAEIQFRDSDPESWVYALSIRDALKAAGWEIPTDPKSIPAARFDGYDLPIAGVTVWNSESEGFFPVIPDDPTVVAQFLGAGKKTEADMRLAALVALLRASPRKDKKLKAGEFRILIGPRDPIH